MVGSYFSTNIPWTNCTVCVSVMVTSQTTNINNLPTHSFQHHLNQELPTCTHASLFRKAVKLNVIHLNVKYTHLKLEMLIDRYVLSECIIIAILTFSPKISPLQTSSNQQKMSLIRKRGTGWSIHKFYFYVYFSLLF